MQILEKILVATDFTKSNENAIQSAIRLAKIFKSSIILLHVLPSDIENEKARELLDKAAKKELLKLREMIENEGVKTDDPILEHGDHLDRIIHISENINANMILIGAGANLDNSAIKLGPTANKIIQKSDKPVMVIQSGKYLELDKVICPVDFSEETSRALENAMIMSRRFNAELFVLHVYDRAYKGVLDYNISWDDYDRELLEKHDEIFSKFLNGFNFTGLKWTRLIKRGDFAKIILNTIAEEKIDFLVIGTSGKKGLSKFLIGSITDRVIREVPCSFLTLKSENVIELKLKAQILDIETHYKNAKQLVEDGMYKSALNQYLICLKTNEMHIPSLNGIASVYSLLGDDEKSEKYSQLAKDVLARIWDSKIEAEVRKQIRR